MDVQEIGQHARGYAGKAPDHPDDQALRPRDPEPDFHPLRRRLQRMVHGPEQAHELQDTSQPGRDGRGFESREHAEVVVGRQ